ncbi:prealbumin-like fold domain-containing protein, partial [[Ruminococcus] lactaris]|uniref:prealbumin-like fold domain-containing protein n=1 Tax=[Ruminococcus] lactaris TaxID=46228 RepID=UPI0023B1CD39
LNGAVYGVYTDAGCKNLTGTLTTDENGMSQELTVSPGQYYIKETSCPTGYALDDTVYPICVFSGQTAMIEVSDIPQKNPVSLILQKKDADTGKSEASGHA